MSELVICEREDLVAIADATREKTGLTNEMTLPQILVQEQHLHHQLVGMIYWINHFMKILIL